MYNDRAFLSVEQIDDFLGYSLRKVKVFPKVTGERDRGIYPEKDLQGNVGLNLSLKSPSESGDR